jgi:hypothetical protein
MDLYSRKSYSEPIQNSAHFTFDKARHAGVHVNRLVAIDLIFIWSSAESGMGMGWSGLPTPHSYEHRRLI